MRQRGVFHKVSGQGPETLSYNEKAGLLAGLGPMVVVPCRRAQAGERWGTVRGLGTLKSCQCRQRAINAPIEPSIRNGIYDLPVT